MRGWVNRYESFERYSIRDRDASWYSYRRDYPVVVCVTSISVSEETKREFDNLKDGQTHDEMMQDLLEAYKTQDTELALEMIVERLTDEIADTVATDIEFAARRGTLEALEEKIE